MWPSFFRATTYATVSMLVALRVEDVTYYMHCSEAGKVSYQEKA